MRDTVLVVDDVAINRILLKNILGATYNVIEACDGVEALDIFRNSSEMPAVVLLDIAMPNMDGHELLKFMKTNPSTKNIPTVFITAETDGESKGRREGALDYIVKPYDPELIKACVDNHVQYSRYRQSLEEMVEEKTREINLIHMKMLDTLATIIEYRSMESGFHIQRTMKLTKILIGALLRNAKFRDRLVTLNYESIIKAVPLHDVGKVGIPDNILLKTDRLTDEEFDIIKAHTTIGGKIIDHIAKEMKDEQMYLKHAREIALFHHERWDGKGYCTGLKGEEIPLSARIVSVVDVYDALVSRRCYKDPFPHDEAIAIIEKGKGTQFDPEIVDAFLEISGECIQL